MKPQKANWLRLSFIICIMFFCPTGAQYIGAQTTFTQQIQQKKEGEGTVTLHQDKSIDDLVNKPTVGNTATTKKQSEGKASTADQNKGNKEKHSTATATTTHGTEQTDTLDNGKKLSHGTKMNGYRVQVFAGGNSRRDRQQAETARNRIKNLFPETAVTVHFHSPRWICRAGNFRTYEEAHQMLEDVRALGYKSAIIIKTKITVQ